jgi:hypothetical protein
VWRNASIAVASAMVAACLIAGTVLASPGRAVTMTLIRSGDDLSEISWSSSGAIADGGGWTTQRHVFGGHEGVSDAFVVAQVLTTQTGSSGAFHLRFEGLENHYISFSGRWELYDGTGAWNLTGSGTWYAWFDEGANQLKFELSGYLR